jgi:mxaJ protein
VKLRGVVLLGPFLLAAAAHAAPFEAPAAASPARALRICADPDNLPYSNEAGEGFDDAVAELLAADLGMSTEYTWWAQRRGFIRHTLKAGRCDVVLGVPRELDAVATTRSYYRSSYVFVTRRDRGLDLRSLDDDRLATLIVGVPLVGDDGANPPPVRALAERGIVDNVRGFPVYADRGRVPAPIDAVVGGTIDVAILWGPIAAHHAARASAPLTVSPIEPSAGGDTMSFDVSIGVRKGDAALRAELDRALERNEDEIGAILEARGVPRP